MTIDGEAFIRLCKELRELGALKVEGHGFVAVFSPAPTLATVRPIAPVANTARPTLARDLAAKTLTDEQLREEAYARELGIV